MVRPFADEADRIIETWESAIAGTTWVWTYNRRDDRYIKTRVGGREGSNRIRISRDDRKYNQEMVPVENRLLDPFTNGTLILVDTANRDDQLDTRYHYTKAQLEEMFELREPELFKEAIEGIESELIIRRLYSMAEKIGTNEQTQILRDICDERWPIGGTQRTVREMIEAGERIGATRMW